jgi:hypothetical protein
LDCVFDYGFEDIQHLKCFEKMGVFIENGIEI